MHLQAVDYFHNFFVKKYIQFILMGTFSFGFTMPHLIIYPTLIHFCYFVILIYFDCFYF